MTHGKWCWEIIHIYHISPTHQLVLLRPGGKDWIIIYENTTSARIGQFFLEFARRQPEWPVFALAYGEDR
jgi:hypothetical protein